MIKDWIDDIINGVGGLLDYERYEIATHSDMHTAEWVIKCLANPKCAGSQQVLDAVIQRRISQLPEVEAINRDNQVTITVGDFEDRYVSRASFEQMQSALENRIGTLQALDTANTSIIKSLRARIAALEAGQQWVSVEERLPDLGGTNSSGQVLMAGDDWVGQGHYSALTGEWYYANGYKTLRPVTHWLPLPPPPSD